MKKVTSVIVAVLFAIPAIASSTIGLYSQTISTDTNGYSGDSVNLIESSSSHRMRYESSSYVKGNVSQISLQSTDEIDITNTRSGSGWYTEKAGTNSCLSNYNSIDAAAGMTSFGNAKAISSEITMNKHSLDYSLSAKDSGYFEAGGAVTTHENTANSSDFFKTNPVIESKNMQFHHVMSSGSEIYQFEIKASLDNTTK